MTYQQQLFDWVVLREVSTCNWVVLSQFRRRCDAEGYQRIAKTLFTGPVEVVFRNRLTEFGISG
ncbi:MAG: hypothetical protein V7K40_31710 [Nostoc sp.]|uniref:hypothetical protein n=1 Tax=Nostoc sp. TaxID=1180 RepID=UPI002FFA0AFD